MTGIYGEGKVSILKGLQGILYAFPRIMIIIIIPGVRRSPQDVLSAPPGRVQGADREVREARHRGRRPRQHRGQRGDAQRHAGAPGNHHYHYYCHYDHHYLQTGKHLGIRISGSCPEPGIFIVEILEDSITALDGRIRAYDRLLSINGTDVRHCKISQASDLIKVSSSYLILSGRGEQTN